MQVPEQHSELCEQASFVWMQNEEPSWQCPPEQSFEQQSASVLQLFPAVWQAVVRGTHLFALHVPLQHSAFALQVWPSDTHWLPEH